MCGLYGFSRSSDITRRMTLPLAIFMAERGHDSWGVTDGIDIFKDRACILESFEEFELEAPFYHTRAASVGAVTQANAHPFEFINTNTNKRIIGMHNGHVINHLKLKHQYEERKGFDVDSMHIFAHLVMDQPLIEIQGWGAVAWYETNTTTPNAPPVPYWSKFGNVDNLHIYELPEVGGLVFASTRRAIEIAANLAGTKLGTSYLIKDRHKYGIETTPAGNHVLVDWGKLDWGTDTNADEWEFVDGHYVHQPKKKESGTSSFGYAGSRCARGVNDQSASAIVNSHVRALTAPIHCATRACNTPLTDRDEFFCADCFRRLKIQWFGISEGDGDDPGDVTAEHPIAAATASEDILEAEILAHFGTGVDC